MDSAFAFAESDGVDFVVDVMSEMSKVLYAYTSTSCCDYDSDYADVVNAERDTFVVVAVVHFGYEC